MPAAARIHEVSSNNEGRRLTPRRAIRSAGATAAASLTSQEPRRAMRQTHISRIREFNPMKAENRETKLPSYASSA